MRNVFNQDIDFAFHNSGNIRSELSRGPISKEQIMTILPFENSLFIAGLKGSEIAELFDYIASIPLGSGGFPQFSKEVRLTIDKTAEKGLVKDLTINGLPVDPEKTYRFCTNGYLLGGGDGYEVLKLVRESFDTSLTLNFVVIEYIKAHKGPVIPVTDGRLTVIGGIKP